MSIIIAASSFKLLFAISAGDPGRSSCLLLISTAASQQPASASSQHQVIFKHHSAGQYLYLAAYIIPADGSSKKSFYDHLEKNITIMTLLRSEKLLTVRRSPRTSAGLSPPDGSILILILSPPTLSRHSTLKTINRGCVVADEVAARDPGSCHRAQTY